MLLIVLVLVSLSGCLGAPAGKVVFGPCAGMDCLHGLLMHGDEEMGDSHRAEDTYEKLQQQDIVRAQKSASGPCKGMDCMHELLMHGSSDDSDVNKMTHHHDQIGPQEEAKQAGPCEGMDCLTDRKIDSTNVRSSNEAESSGSQQTFDVDPDSMLHGKLSERHDHGTADNHKHAEETVRAPGTFDPDLLLHGGHNEHGEEGSSRRTVVVEPPITAPANDAGSFLGYSFNYISDTLFDNIDLLKLRYLKKFWSADTEGEPNENKDAFM